MKNLILVLIGAMFMVSCKKEISRELPGGISYQMPPKDVVLELDEKLVATRKKNPHGNPHDNPPPPTQPPPPESTAKKACILLDFNGQKITSGLWSVDSVADANLTQTQIDFIVARCKKDYSFNDSILVTVDENAFNSFPENKRMRVIATTSWQWYGQVGGVAYIGSLNWYGQKEAFVFTPLLSGNEKFIADAMSHEAGHTANARHHADWRQCVLFSQYLVGDDIMGNSYAAAIPLFKIAANDICCDCIEDTKQVINNSVNQ